MGDFPDMMFPERITGIRPDDRVLEVGPGACPHPKSHVFIELNFSSEAEAIAQRAGIEKVDPSLKEKKIVLYDGGAFPFADKAFDYVICSQVIEHVPDVESFVCELTRVSSAGYLEFPSVYYEYLYNFDVHLNFLAYVNGEVLYMPKSVTPLDSFYPIQQFFYATLNLGATDLVDSFKEYMSYGFEWTAPFPVRRATTINEFIGPLPTAFKRVEPAPAGFASNLVGRITSLFGKV
jgi:ubiquinone/menaquinone biosynthesis C-methylase UbiE